VTVKEEVSPGGGRKLWVKVKMTGDKIEINLDKNRPEKFDTEEDKIKWEMATARNALKFKKQVENGDFIPPEIKKKLEEKQAITGGLTKEEMEILTKEKQLENRKDKLRWLRIEQRIVDLDMAVKTALHLERPEPEKCIAALDELETIAVTPLVLKKQPDIFTTIRRLRKYIGPHEMAGWTKADDKEKMNKCIKVIQEKAEKIYDRFKTTFNYKEGSEVAFADMFEVELNKFKDKTKEMEELEMLALIKDPTENGSS